ncbi:GDP-mannose pyrophosphatase NudK [Larkinella terrae]|uniref:GDP-mannose pyrophosphatase n=1 Tax=Larkinella terrae TaxID=2025311 RepID=A0A7K0EQ45_9BACT|nr:GDP-mannose pyrophosphatase NudK [Larkinella terrae]MRS63934.1 GDP-mannose pyrophosphatase NudK [Larkinella terrae]
MNNSRVQLLKDEVLSDNWYVLRKVTFKYLRKDGIWETQTREAYDRGNGATILLHNTEKNTVILTRQFRMPTYVNGNASGLLIEACAGLLDNDNPEDAIRRETEEETGFVVTNIQKVFEAYMSPGSVTEKLYFFTAEYSDTTEKRVGGGIDEEDIDVLELPLSQAMQMVGQGEIVDGKTIMLLQHLFIQQLLSV